VIDGSPHGAARKVEVSADKRLKYEAPTLSIEDMDNVSRKIAAAIDELYAFYARIQAELQPWPDTQYQQSLDKHPLRAILNPGSAT